jgi:hypothetical protein
MMDDRAGPRSALPRHCHASLLEWENGHYIGAAIGREPKISSCLFWSEADVSTRKATCHAQHPT